MGEVHRKPGGLEMSHDPGHEKTEWIVQRVGWGLMLLLCIAALAGVLGGGPVSSAQEGKIGDDLYLEYDRYVRHQAPFSVKIFCKPSNEKEFSLAFSRAFLDKHEMKEIQPEPESTVIAGSNCVFLFKGDGREEQLITFRFEPDAFGKTRNDVTLDGKRTRKMEQFIWP